MRTSFARGAAALAAVAVLCSAPAGGRQSEEPPAAGQGGAPFALQRVGPNFSRPIYVTHAGDGTDRLFVVEKDGAIKVLVDGQTLEFLDIDSRVESGGFEQGLLSVAFHPDYESNGRFFVFYTEADFSLVVAEYGVSSNPNVASAAERRLLRIPHPGQRNHNGGLLKFGPDGYLYVGVGDGGGGGDPQNNGQNRNVLLGKILRIDVDSGDPYGIPPDNPFVDVDDSQPEVWAYGLRNPWRFSFDRETGELWAGDVGQNEYEEVDIVERGGNYGWRVMEGFHCFNPASGCNMAGLEPPVFEYSHDGSNGAAGCSITGGYVYRGAAIPSLRGVYLFADYCTGAGTLYGIRRGDSRATSYRTDVDGPVVSFGEDRRGELYVVVDGSPGGVYKVVGGCPSDITVVDDDGDGSEAVEFATPQPTGNCGTVTCTSASGTVFPVGTTTVNCSAPGGGCACSFTVTVQPGGGLEVTGVDPPSASRKTRLTVTITGSGFEEGASVSFGRKIKVLSTTVVSPTRVDAEIRVKKAQRGARDVTIANPGGASATCAGCFTVE